MTFRTSTVCLKDTKCHLVKLAALWPFLFTAQQKWNLIGFTGNLNPAWRCIWAKISWAEVFRQVTLFDWLNIHLSLKTLWWYYSEELIYLLVCKEPQQISYVLRSYMSLIWRQRVFFSIHCYIGRWSSGSVVTRNRWPRFSGVSLSTVFFKDIPQFGKRKCFNLVMCRWVAPWICHEEYRDKPRIKISR